MGKKAPKNERRMISEMMERPSWLWHKDLDFVKSVSQQLKEGRRTEPSKKQAQTIRAIYRRWKKNQETRVFQGGLPGHGKRR